jgi:hypothetical protein
LDPSVSARHSWSLPLLGIGARLRLVIKHIVLWKLKDNAGGRSRDENAALIKRGLEGLQGVIDGLLRIEVGFDFSRGEHSSDLALYSEFESRAALDAYQSHPAHKAIMPLVLEARSERRVVDYET